MYLSLLKASTNYEVCVTGLAQKKKWKKKKRNTNDMESHLAKMAKLHTTSATKTQLMVL